MAFEMLSWAVVYLYGLILTASFLNIRYSKKGLFVAIIQFALCFAAQFALQLHFGYHAVEMTYPLICHLPIWLMSVLAFKRSPTSAAVALLAAYLLTIPRNLIGELAAVLWNAPYTRDAVKILITLPLLALIMQLLTPAMRRLLLLSRREQWLFLTPAFMYYVMIYVTTVYTDIAYTGNLAVISLLVTLMCFCTFAYVFLDYRQLTRIAQLHQKQQIADLQSSETALRMEEIRYSQMKTKTMRHDLRHYLQIIYDYAADGNTAAIQSYIRDIQDEIEDTVVQQYCRNEPVNLLLSSYAGRAKRQGAELSVSAAVPETLSRELDVCVLLANGLENALHACAGLEKPEICVECNQYAGKTVVQIKNPYEGRIVFADGLPKSDREGHGLGTRSIVNIAESRGGAADFSAEDGIFTLRAVL